MSEVSVSLTLRASERCLASSSFSLLLSRLHTQNKPSCQGLLTLPQVEFELQTHFSEVRPVAVGIKLLRIIAPGTPTPFCDKTSSVTLFSRRETSGMPQKSVSEADSSTTLARFSDPSPLMLFQPTL